MGKRGLIKRVLPFVAALSVGIFIASFFVDISAPRFKRGDHGRRFRVMQELRQENQELRDENFRLRNELEKNQLKSEEFTTLEDKDSPMRLLLKNPPLPVAPPAPPVAPHHHNPPRK